MSRSSHNGNKPSSVKKLMENGETPYLLLELDQIQSDPNQPRREMGDLKELQVSITRFGVIEPIVVTEVAQGQFQIISGERRFRAAKAAKMKRIPAILRTSDNGDVLEVQISENLLRKELSPLELAESYRRLIDQHKWSQAQLAKRIGKSQSTISETLRILSLPEGEIEGYRTSDKMSRSALLEVAKNNGRQPKLVVADRATSGNLTVRQLRNARKPKAAQSTTIEIKTKHAIVTIAAQSGSLSNQDARDALDEASIELEERG
ncbi:MAG: ParB/RepB/Spo0J family partition protein [Candidatus Sumerlaeaceae bacterium]|nr:ParB/RepB/Spo0J family partition protein [Candidatus Sumerlaeaceae bacterium]